jgi:cell division septation protein DedD
VQPEPASGASATQPTPSKNAATAADGMIVGDKPPQSAVTNQPPAISPSGTIMVQIAAVSSQDVADILLASLRKKGYSVSVRHEPQDKLLHIQIGPFANRKDAEAMQQRILADGFNAIVK